MNETYETAGVDETIALGRELAGRFGVGDCVAVVGPLGAGKTALIRGVALGLGVGDARTVSSPTYVLVHEYEGRVPVYHVDLYRLRAAEAELADLGTEEMLADGVVLVEWADRAADALPTPRWQVEISVTGETKRQFHLYRVHERPGENKGGPLASARG